MGISLEAEDIAQQTFLKLYRCPEQVKGQEDELNVVGWLYRVALNEGYNALRSRKRRMARQENFVRKWLFNTSSPDPAEVVEQQDAQGRVRQILAGMKSRQARLLLLRRPPDSLVEFSSSTLGFTLSYPQDWLKQETGRYDSP